MAHDATTLVKQRRFGSTSVKAVVLVLADYADTTWSCFVGQRRLAFEAEVGERTARRILADLEARGLIARQRRTRADGTRTSDRIVLVKRAIAALPAMMAADDVPADDDCLPATVAGGDEGLPATDDSPTGQSLAGEPLEEPPDLTLVQPSGLNQPDAPFAAGFRECWEAYPRKEARKDAMKAYQARRREGIKHDDLLNATKIYADVCAREARETRHVLLGKTFFGPSERWMDYRDPPTTREREVIER